MDAAQDPTGGATDAPPTSGPYADVPSDTGHSGWTSTDPPCIPVEEVVADGVDGDCDGWADEFGVGEPLEGVQLATGTRHTTLGGSLDVRAVADGEVWWLAGSRYGDADMLVGAPGLADPSVEGVLVPSPGFYTYFSFFVTLGNFDDAATVAVSNTSSGGNPRVYPLGVWDESEFVTEVAGPPDDPYSFNATVRAGNVDGDLEPLDELVLGVGNLYVIDSPIGVPEWWNPRLTVIATAPEWHSLGFSLGPPTDLDGDGLEELLAGGQYDSGRVWVIPGGLSGTVALLDVAVWVEGEVVGDDLGTTQIETGDANGDGHADIVTGAILANARAGRGYLLNGPFPENRSAADADATLEADYPNDFCGVGGSILGDQDGDGTNEVVWSCPRDLYQGLALPGRIQLYANASGTLGLADAERVWVGASRADSAGWATGAGDLNGDGIDDLVVSASHDDRAAENAGIIWLLEGPLL